MYVSGVERLITRELREAGSDWFSSSVSVEEQPADMKVRITDRNTLIPPEWEVRRVTGVWADVRGQLFMAIGVLEDVMEATPY